MREVVISGIGMLPVGEHWSESLRSLGAEAIHLAMKDANISDADALYVGNAFGVSASSQAQIGALLADHSGLSGIEAFTVEAGDASGGVALRTGYMAVASGLCDTVIVAGVEKVSDSIAATKVAARSVALDADYETVHGATVSALAGLLMRRYMYENSIESTGAFEGFTINAHRNGKLSKYAMFRNTVREGSFARAPLISDPVNLFDGAPEADGAAAVVLTAKDKLFNSKSPGILIRGSGASTDKFALQDRDDITRFRAVERSTQKALSQAELNVNDINVFEISDMFTVMTAITLESIGLSSKGEGWKLALNSGDKISLSGDYPISTFGGLKSRGNPSGATGIYQAVEACLQLRGQANDNQVSHVKNALIQNVSGIGTTAVTHILSLI